MCVFSECCKNVFLARIQGQISLQATVKVPPLQPPPITKQTSGQQSSSKAVPLLGSAIYFPSLCSLPLSKAHAISPSPLPTCMGSSHSLNLFFLPFLSWKQASKYTKKNYGRGKRQKKSDLFRGAWMAQLVKHAILDLRVVS